MASAMLASRRIVAVEVVATAALILGLATIADARLLHFRVDPYTSEVSAAVDEPGRLLRGKAVGRFTLKQGEISGDPSQIGTTARVSLIVDANSYSSGNARRDVSVRDKALESDAYSTIRFDSTQVTDVAMKSANEGAVTVVGNLTLHGITRQIRIPVHAALDAAGRLLADGTLSVSFADYDIKPISLIPHLLETGDVATINFRIVALPD